MRKQLIGKAVSTFMTGVIAAGSIAPAFLSPYMAMAGEQLGQTDFDEGVGLPWHICESAPGEMDFEIDNGVYKITIVNPGGASQGGEDRWDCQFRHRGLKIVSGHQYRVSYEITASNSGKYYTKIGNLDGDVEIWHNMSTGDGDFNNSWDPIQINANETKKVEVTFTPSQSMEVAEWAFHLGGDGQYTPGGCFPAGTVITFDNMSLTDLSGDENDYIPAEKWQRADILTNQVGYFTDRAKRATLLCDDKKGVKYEVLDENGKKVCSGKSEYFGYDDDSGDVVHIIDFSELDKAGTYHIEAENGAVSREFEVGGSDKYSSMLYDSLNYFYQNRSGIDIEASLISSGDADALARKAGHPTDMAEIEHTWGYSATSGSIDVTGGWYDAGDHGKYVVNGGFSLWMMQNQYETAVKYGFKDKYADGTMNIPENTNGYPDLLDEARWEMDWMFSMIVDSGEYKDMVYHKAHDEKWTALGIAPADDTMKRIVKPPTTAATLNFAACAAQSARLWKGIDDSFSEKCLEAAEKCFAAAKEHPAVYAPLDESVGGGAYGDDDVTDEFCWAASELYITTGDMDYYNDIKKSDFFLDVPTSLGGGESVDTIGSLDWGNTAALGTLSAALNPDAFDKGDSAKIRDAVTDAADFYIDTENSQGYGLPYGASKLAYNDSDEGYVWGSNSFVTDNSIVIAYAYLLTDDDKYMDGTIAGMDYILGRNPMDYSYVTGYGTHTTEYPHHRYWSQLIDDSFPKAPCGVMAGGPNSGMQDPWVQGSGWKKGAIAPQKCYLDHIEAWCVNECTINWNASLAWVAGFLAEENGGITVGETGRSAGIVNNGGDGESNGKPTYKDDSSKNDSTKSEVTTRSKASSKDSEKNSSGVWIAVAVIVAVVAFAGVVLAIALMIFIYKMFRLKAENGGGSAKSGNKENDERKQ
ncbi:MAG: glycoside hydrolase family 9 protein [Ruminococcus sp.]|nr:glycoside hydrolase family 9 protein [Ruminococcus sp.]